MGTIKLRYGDIQRNDLNTEELLFILRTEFIIDDVMIATELNFIDFYASIGLEVSKGTPTMFDADFQFDLLGAITLDYYMPQLFTIYAKDGVFKITPEATEVIKGV